MDLLHPYGDLDTLGWYSKVSPYLENFLGKQEIATKTIGENFVLLKRGTKMPPLFIQDMKWADEIFLKLRVQHHLDDVKDQLTKKQILLWQYFVPRKLVNFFYACNNEYGKTMDKIFIDIDRQDKSAEDAQKVAATVAEIITKDKLFAKFTKHKMLIMRTGSSFHIMLMLPKTINHQDYDRYFSFGPKKTESFVMKRAEEASNITKLNVIAGHERRKGAIILDTSNTPPGKLARCPFSLHIKDYKTIDGITVPLNITELRETGLISKLKKLTPETIRKDIKRYSKIIQESLW